MKREIKFRGWHKTEKYITRILDLQTIQIEQGRELHDYEWMQYTGLKDKNGKEGYHKDIIKRLDNLYILEWHGNLASWYLKPICGGWHGITGSDFALMCEVIGNIYEHSCLLDNSS